MSELSAAIGGSGPRHHIVCGGKRYPVSLVTQAVKVAYGVALYERARAALASVRGITDKDHYERKLDALVEKYETGGFALESDFGRESLGKPGGSLLLLSILLGEFTPDGTGVTPMPEVEVINVVSQAPDEVATVFKTVLKESFPGMSVDDAPAPAGAPAGPKG